ncbi:MAG: helix-turn-helix domain-containing protein [Vicinamibacterales bacterium]
MECGGNISEAARRLRINRTSVQRWLKRPAPTSSSSVTSPLIAVLRPLISPQHRRTIRCRI